MQECKRRCHVQHWFETKLEQGMESEFDINREQQF